MASIDFAPAIGAVAPYVLAAGTAVISVGVSSGARLAKRYLGLALTAQQVAALAQAADRGAELAYGFLVANATHYADVPMRNAALAMGVNHVLGSVPDAIKAIGKSPEDLHAMVDARLAGLLAKDPTVSIAPPPNAAAPKSTPAPPDKPAS